MSLARKACSFLGWALLACAETLPAAQWKVSGGVGQSILFNDNIALSAFRKTPVFGYVLVPALEGERKGGAFDVRLRGRGDIRRYDDSNWDCNNYSVELGSAYRTRRQTFALNGSYGISCSYIQQLRDTGILLPTSEIESFTVSPDWSWQLTRRNTLFANISYSQTNFTENKGAELESIGFSGNDTFSVAVGSDYAWSRRLVVNGGLQYSRIEYSAPSNATQDLYGFQVGANYRLSRRWKAGAGVGLRWVEFVDPLASGAAGGTSSQTLGHVAKLNLAYEGQLNGFSVDYSNSISPSAFGETRQFHILSSRYTHQFGRRVSLDLGANFVRNEPLSGKTLAGSLDNASRDFFTGSASLVYEFARDWQLRGTYSYLWQEYQSQLGTADANLVMLSLNYSWPGVRRGR
jgi:hypothetical protein